MVFEIWGQSVGGDFDGFFVRGENGAGVEERRKGEYRVGVREGRIRLSMSFGYDVQIDF